MAAVLFVAAGAVTAQVASVSAPVSAPVSTTPQFAPGVLTTIEPDVDPEDTFGVHDVVELRADATLAREPNLNTKSRTLYDMAHAVVFRRDVWCLELSFKPLRMVYVDIPQPTGKMQRKLVWYLVYRVRNTGAAIGPEQQDDGSYLTVSAAAGPRRFIPQFALASQDLDRQGNRVRKEYLDRLVPAAMPVIRRREFSGGELLSSVEMAERMLQPESGRMQGGLWGVAIWEDVDPEIDFLSIYVGGLTNAYRWKDAEDFQAGDPPGKGRMFLRKTLQLNFWRPGDSLAENEREIRYGAALGAADAYGTNEGVAYRWVYR
ncbi:MAG: hypothetical protein IH898_11385 [Planctomycetes bacterium]|nr:hypothetical protein [Planctomycetota bacterium]